MKFSLFAIFILLTLTACTATPEVSPSPVIETVAPTPSPTLTPTISPEEQKALDDKLKAEADAKALVDKQAKEKADADAKKAAADKKKKLDAAVVNLIRCRCNPGYR